MGKINDAPQKSKKEKARKERKMARKSKEVRKKERKEERKKERKKAQSFGGTTDAVAEGLGLLVATA